jgi:hypothetical protein
MKLKFVSVAMLFTLLCALVLVPAGTASAKPKPGQGNNKSLKSVKATGKFGDATVAVTQFSVNDAGKLVASGKVTHPKKGEIGSFSDALVTVSQGPSVSAAGAAFAAQQQATCPILTLSLAPITLDLLGLVVQTSAINLVITGETGAGNLLGNLLCAITGILDDPSALSQILNRILALLGGTLTSGSPLTGALPISIDKFATMNGELVARFYVNQANGKPVGPFFAPAQVIEPPDGACDILSLTLGPIDLDLLGLRIQLYGETPEDPITILIYAVPGPGNLLGNLLCAIVGLLDRDAPAAAVATKLNQVLKAVG